MTLFVRNIPFDINETQFSDFFAKFGPLEYALLCKVKDLGDVDKDQPTHKGTGFVKFKTDESAKEVLKI